MSPDTSAYQAKLSLKQDEVERRIAAGEAVEGAWIVLTRTLNLGTRGSLVGCDIEWRGGEGPAIYIPKRSALAVRDCRMTFNEP